MKTRIQKWGNSLALRIPKSFAVEVGLENETCVDIALTDGKLMISPVIKPGQDLEWLLAKVTVENLHHEVDTGRVTGKETW